jgi:hypothetical protein
MSLWTVSFDDDYERVFHFDDEASAVEFAEIDAQLEGVLAVVGRHDPDGTTTVLRVIDRRDDTSAKEGDS